MENYVFDDDTFENEDIDNGTDDDNTIYVPKQKKKSQQTNSFPDLPYDKATGNSTKPKAENGVIKPIEDIKHFKPVNMGKVDKNTLRRMQESGYGDAVGEFDGYKIQLDPKGLLHILEGHGTKELKEGISGSAHQGTEAIKEKIRGLPAKREKKIQKAKKKKNSQKEIDEINKDFAEQKKTLEDDLSKEEKKLTEKYSTEEYDRGNRTIRKEYFQNIQKYIKGADEVEFQEYHKRFKFTKYMDKGQVIVVLEQDEKNKVFRVVTLFHEVRFIRKKRS